MKHIRLTLTILTLLAFSAVSAFAAKYNFLIATDAPAGSSWVKAMEEISLKMQKKFGKDSVEIKVFAGGTMRDNSAVIKKIKMKQLSGAALSSGGAQLICKDFGILGFPRMFRTYDEYDYFIDNMGGYFEKEFEKNGFVLMGWSEVGFIQIFSKKPISNVEELRNGKPFILEGDTITKALYDEIKIKPVTTRMADIMTDLNTGRIETTFCAPYALIATQWFTKVSYMTNFPITFMLGTIVVDKDLFYSMPADYQAEMKKLFKEYMTKLTNQMRKDNDSAKENLITKVGLKQVEVEAGSAKIFEDVCEKASENLVKTEYNRETYETIKALLDNYRAKKGSHE